VRSLESSEAEFREVSGGVSQATCKRLIKVSSVVAGGYDAIYVLVVDPPDSTPADGPSIAEQVRLLWSNWKSLSVSPLQSRAEGGGLRYYDSVTQVRGLERSL
jgi:hypothetical protein